VSGFLRVRLNGGIGNQLFQYSAGYALAQRWGKKLEIEIPRESLQNFHGHPRPYALDSFAITAAPKPFQPFYRFATSRSTWLIPILDPLRKSLSITLIDEIPGKQTLPSLLSEPEPSGNISLSGYWQQPDVLPLIEEKLRLELAFKRPALDSNRLMLEMILKDPCAVSLHVRRGDYLKIQDAPLLSLDYYRSSISQMIDRIRSLHPPDQTQSIVHTTISFYIFSDDMPWCRAYLPQLFSASASPNVSHHFVNINNEENAAEDLRLMSSCRHHIVAKSSFSFWGAWLNPSPSKIVIQPGTF
jgi:hypothetical protein